MDKKLKTLSDYRLDQAERCIKSAKILVADDDCKGAANKYKSNRASSILKRL